MSTKMWDVLNYAIQAAARGTAAVSQGQREGQRVANEQQRHLQRDAWALEERADHRRRADFADRMRATDAELDARRQGFVPAPTAGTVATMRAASSLMTPGFDPTENEVADGLARPGTLAIPQPDGTARSLLFDPGALLDRARQARPTATPPRVDPLSVEGIRAAVERKRQLGQVGGRGSRAPGAPRTPPRGPSLADQEATYIRRRLPELMRARTRPGKVAGMSEQVPGLSMDEAVVRAREEFRASRGEAPGAPAGGERSGASASSSGDLARQRAMYDAAAAELRNRGQNPTAILGPRP